MSAAKTEEKKLLIGGFGETGQIETRHLGQKRKKSKNKDRKEREPKPSP